MEFSEYLKNFFFADGYRVAIIILLTFGLIFFLSIIYITWKANLRFSLIFIVMINAMISGIISPFGYLFNWVIKDSNDNSILLFGESEGFLCQFQAFTLATFQCSRESFVTLVMVISFLKVRFPEMNISSSKINVIAVLIFGYGIPAAEVLIFMKLHVWGQSHLFCFTGMVKEGNKYSGTIVTCGLIHFIYIIVLIVISNLFILDILIRVNKMRKSYIDRNSDPEAGTTGCICCDPLLKKLVFYPFAQIVSMSLPIYYRIVDWFGGEVKFSPSGPAAVMNAISSFIYTAIFFLSNNQLRQVEYSKGDSDEEIDKVLEMNSDILSRSTND